MRHWLGEHKVASA